jgi:DNA-binding IclR family transcriptional regulator
LLPLDVTVQGLRGIYGGRSFMRFSDETPAGVEALATLLEKDRKRGFVVSRSFFAAGLLAISAPIRDASRKVIGAISVTNLEGAVPPGRGEERIRDAVVRAAQDISQRHGAPPLAVSAASRRPAAGPSSTRR